MSIWSEIVRWGSIAAASVTGGYGVWKKGIKPTIDFFKEYEQVKKNAAGIVLLTERQNYLDKKTDSIIHLSNKPMFVCNEEGLCVLANKAICTLFGATEQQMKGYGWLNFIHWKDRSRVEHDWKIAIEMGSEDIISSYRVVHGETTEIVEVTYHSIISRGENRQVLIAVGKVETTV